MNTENRITVFSKPWPDDTIGKLANRLRSLGFEGLELAVRDGYQVTPDTVETELAGAVSALRDEGLDVHSVASELTEAVFAGCARAGVPLIRIQVSVPVKEGYFAAKDRFRKSLDTLMPLCERYDVSIAVQIHSGQHLARSTEVMETIRDYSPKHVTVVWDVGHAAIVGEDPEYGVSTCGAHLSLANFKNFRFERVGDGIFRRINCVGDEGLGSWAAAVEVLSLAKYTGAYCVSAAYGPGDDVDSCAKHDCDYLRNLIASR